MKLRLFDRVIFYVNVLSVGGLFCAWFAAQVDPRDFWPIAFMGISYPLFLVVAASFAFYWMFRRRWLVLISGVAIVLSWGHTAKLFNIDTKSGSEQGRYSTFTWNMRSLDVYNYEGRANTAAMMIEVIKRMDADILTLQEFTYSDTGNFNNLKTIQGLGYKYYKFNLGVSWNLMHYGMITFSKYPIVGSGYIKFEETNKNGVLYTDIRLTDTIIRVYNSHLQSIGFSHSDYKGIEQLKEKPDVDMPLFRNLATKMRSAFSARARQLDLLLDHAAGSPFPVMICGDMNSTPTSYLYNRVTSAMTDAFMECGSGFGTTYNGPLPGLRIDYMFSAPGFYFTEYKRSSAPFSDHFPIRTRWDIH